MLCQMMNGWEVGSYGALVSICNSREVWLMLSLPTLYSLNDDEQHASISIAVSWSGECFPLLPTTLVRRTFFIIIIIINININININILIFFSGH
jgi:hypothetical protein